MTSDRQNMDDVIAALVFGQRSAPLRIHTTPIRTTHTHTHTHHITQPRTHIREAFIPRIIYTEVLVRKVLRACPHRQTDRFVRERERARERERVCVCVSMMCERHKR